MGNPIVLDKDNAYAAAQAALKYVLTHMDADERVGGYFAIFQRDPSGKVGKALVLEIIGTIIPEKISLYCRLVREKVNRLSRHTGEISSWLSRDPDNDQWGGAIIAENYYVSFSGLPELCDEAIVLITARILGIISGYDAMRIAEISNNELYKQWASSAQAMR